VENVTHVTGVNIKLIAYLSQAIDDSLRGVLWRSRNLVNLTIARCRVRYYQVGEGSTDINAYQDQYPFSTFPGSKFALNSHCLSGPNFKHRSDRGRITITDKDLLMVFFLQATDLAC